MKNHLLGICFILAYLFVNGQDHTLELYKGAIPNNRAIEMEEKWDTTDLVKVSQVQCPNIAVYLPPQKVATGQAVIICPGGGYERISYQWEGVEVAKWLNTHGIAAIILKYRLPNSPNNIVPELSPLLDAKRAIRLVRHHAKNWHIDRQKVGIMGFSAGGHLASMLATQFDNGTKGHDDPVERISSRPDFTVLIYPVISMYPPNVHMGSRISLLGENPGEELLKQYSSHVNVTGSTPPVFLVHASDDRAVPVENSILFYQAMVDVGQPVEIHIYPFGGHGFSLGLQIHYLNSWTDRCIDWLEWLITEGA
jgi:acetyl esterase/lipase